MSRITHRHTLEGLIVALLAILLSASGSYAQATADNPQATWPTGPTLGFGGGVNDNWNGSAGYNPESTTGDFTQNASHIGPEFHLLGEFPIGGSFMFAPRIAYNNYSMSWDAATSTAGQHAGPQKGLQVAEQALGVDALLKWAPNNFHVMAGANISGPMTARYAYSDDKSAASDGANLPNKSRVIVGLKGGLGYDISLNSKNTIWLTPEAFFSYNVSHQSAVPDGSDNNFHPVTLTGAASLKFALNGPPEAPPPPAIVMNATITAHGIMPDGSVVAEPVSPQQALHTRASMPMLPYIFFDNNSAAIPTRYSRSGATGFSEQSELAGKDALDANHHVLDIVGERMKNDPAKTITLVGTNSNTKEEKNDITLSKARATAVADYLESTWGIAPSRITIDQRNLPELPTNPVTGAGQQENRRVEIRSSDEDLTSPIKIENRQAISVGATQVRYDMTVSPDPSVHTYSSWTLTMDKDGTPIGSPVSGNGAPPSSKTMEIPGGESLIGQPIHYTLTVKDADGQTAHADGYTRVEAKTVDRDNLEKYAMLSFDFDRSEINQRARQMLQLISESISREATGVKIDGYCDSTGRPEYNQTLSEARANAAVTELRSMTSLPANVVVHGHGVRDPKFANDLPEGRQLNRRVEFTIEKAGQ